MRCALTFLAFVLPVSHLAGQVAGAASPKKKIPAIALLPDGSELQNVSLPRYDEDLNLTAELKADAMTLVSAGQIAGRAIALRFFNPDTSVRGRIDLARAIFDQNRGLLIAREPVEIQSPRMSARGSGLYYAFEQGEGFLSGPVTTTISASTETTMKSPSSSPLRATALLGMAMVSQPLAAAPPPSLTAEQTAQLQADAESRSGKAAEASAQSSSRLESDLTASASASQAAQTFLAQADLPNPGPDADAPATAPLQVTPGPSDTVINCDGGMYFDAEEGVLVYLKNVTVKDPRFDLSGANELKIFFAKKAPKASAPAKDDKTPKASTPGEDGKATEKAASAAEKKPSKTDSGFGSIGANFSEVERIVATGAVKITQNASGDKPPINASGAVFTYNLKEKHIIMSGGYPWFTQGSTFMRATEPNLQLLLFPETASFRTEGRWEMGGNFEKKNP